jgi:hypothetical protein
VAPARALLWLSVGLPFWGCGEETPFEPGLTEPIVVHEGTFYPGPLPGAATTTDPETVEGPRVTALEAPGGIGIAGQRSRTVTGRVSAETYAVAVRLDGAGSGYWVRPVDAMDPAAAGERAFRLEFGLAEDAPVGRRVLRFAALDGAGRAGLQRQLRVCVTPSLPDNLNACDPTIKPPAVVVRLAWDVLADVDLVVITPDGRVVSPAHPRTVAPAPTSGEAPDVSPPEVGVIDLDAGAGCRSEGPRAEHLVFQERPKPGRYLVYARLVDPCGAPAVQIRGSLHARTSHPDGTWSQERLHTRAGTLPRTLAEAETADTFLFPVDL